ncbi:hypothetical protein ACHZ98_24045 [Streptomyces sp. MAR4 CNY-716]
MDPHQAVRDFDVRERTPIGLHDPAQREPAAVHAHLADGERPAAPDQVETLREQPGLEDALCELDQRQPPFGGLGPLSALAPGQIFQALR